MLTNIGAVPDASSTIRERLPRYAFPAGLLAICTCALAIRLVPLILGSGIDRAIANSSETYLELSDGLSRGCGFAVWAAGKCSSPEISRTPGYPVFLWLLPGWRAAIFVQCVISAATCFLAGAFSYRRWGTKVGALTAIMLAVNVPSIVYSDKIMTEVLFTGLLTAGFVSELSALKSPTMGRKSWLFLWIGSFLFAAAVLVRPIGQVLLFLIAIPPVLVLRREGWLRRMAVVACLILMLTLAIVGWSQRNWRKTGIRTFSTVGAFNLYYFRAAGVAAYSSGRGLIDVWRTWDQVKPEEMGPRAMKILMAHPMATAYTTVRGFVYVSLIPDRGPLAKLIGAEAFEAIKDPGSFRVFETLKAKNGGLASIYADECDSSPFMAILLIFQTVTILFVWVGIALALRAISLRSSDYDFSLIFLLAVALALLLLASGPEATARFRIPAMPFLSVVAAVGWMRALRPGERSSY